MSRNVDTVSVSPKGGLPSSLGGVMHPVDSSQLFDPTQNTGSKTLASRGDRRIRQFAQWVFEQRESMIVAVGHSLYFKEFFKTYLDSTFDHKCKTKKIKNAGVVSFDITQDSEGNIQIAQNSITPIFLGFCK